MRRVAFVINPVGVRHLRALERHCEETAARNGWQPELMGTEAGESKGELVDHLHRYATAAGDRLVFAIGGDGTVRTCADALAYSGAALAIVPRGTANLFARALGVPGGLDAALRVGFGAEERLVDLAACEGPGGDGAAFAAMAGIGLDAAVVHSTPRFLKEHLGWVGYAAGALAHLGSRPHEFALSLDGGPPIARRAHSVVVGNVGILPGGFSILPGASVEDGRLDVGILSPQHVLGWAVMASRILAHGHDVDRQFEHHRASTVEVTTGTDLPRELDGDVIAPGRSLSVKVLPKALLVRAPVSSEPMPGRGP
jgi:YegS/Rv2252/BmrU family lipid kinase